MARMGKRTLTTILHTWYVSWNTEFSGKFRYSRRGTNVYDFVVVVGTGCFFVLLTLVGIGHWGFEY